MIYNFAPGPAMLPEAVRQQIHAEWFNWNNTGCSVVEISHRSPLFESLIEENRALLRELLSIPQSYEILFLPGGAQTQFALVPMNLLGKTAQADYLVYGHWGNLAFHEAERYGNIQSINIKSSTSPYSLAIDQLASKIRNDSVYLHYCSNETIEGICLPSIPNSPIPLVADMSSDILSRPINIPDFKLIYASTQKNLGVAGLCVLIVHHDWLDQAMPHTPSILNYQKQAAAKSLLNTINTFACYVLNLVLKWSKNFGGLENIAKYNQQKAQLLYSYLDQQDFFHNSIADAFRSNMNVTFSTTQPELDKIFAQEAEKVGLLALKGHKVFGGMRASLYNSMPIEGVNDLVNFMQDFARCYE